jgi:hypothetical protein
LDDTGDFNSALQPVAQISTQSGARTMLFVPQTDQILVSARAEPLGNTVYFLIYEPF